MDKSDLHLAAEWIANSNYMTAFTGAGISVESGIPAFRGEEGIWNKYDPDILDIDNYLLNPGETWPVIRKLFYEYFTEASPNEAHRLLAILEERGILKSIITQNIDNMHQEAGNKNVIEYHGNSHWMVCTECGERTEFEERLLSADVPRCKKDQALLKPDFVFFGEPIPEKAAHAALFETEKTDLILMIGTTGEVMPASMIPRMAKNAGARLIEINTEKSLYTNDITDLFFQGKAGEVAKELLTLL